MGTDEPNAPVRPGDARRARRRAREQAIIATARALVDEQGHGDVSVDRIARATGINKALIYRAFDSKEEIFVLVVADHLSELDTRLAALPPSPDAVADLDARLDAYTGFCLEYPAFADGALALMRTSADEQRERVSGAVWFRLGRAMAACVGAVEAVLTRGAERGVFHAPDPAFAANRLFLQILGTVHLARVGLGVREVAPGLAGAFPLAPERVRAACVQDALASVLARPAAPAIGATT